MKAIFMIENPSEIEATMKITMTLKKWEELRQQLGKSYPSWKLSAMITDLLAQANNVYCPTIEDKEAASEDII